MRLTEDALLLALRRAYAVGNKELAADVAMKLDERLSAGQDPPSQWRSALLTRILEEEN